MSEDPYPEAMNMLTARARYFELNGFGESGGYNDAFVKFALGPLAVSLPNTQSRLRAVRYHDLHHVVTGYQTNTLGEFEISAWELGAGCRGFVAAWVLNLAGVAGGVLRAPGRTWRAFLRGRHSHTLYHEDLDTLLAETVGQVRARTGVHGARASGARWLDACLFALFAALGLVIGTLLVLIGVPLALPLAALTALRGAGARRGAQT